MLVEHAAKPLIRGDGFDVAGEVAIFVLGVSRADAMAEILALGEKPLPSPRIAALLRRRNTDGQQPSCHELSGFIAALDQEINYGGEAREQNVARGLPLAAVGAPLPLRLRPERLDTRLEIDEGLQVLLGHAFLGQLGNQHMQAFRAERGLIADVWTAGISLPECPQGRAQAIN